MELSSITGKPSANLEMFNLQSKAKGKTTLNQEDFFKLLTAQLSAQDPLKPMDDMSFISQMASFSSLQQMEALSKSFASFSEQQGMANASSYLGKKVTLQTESGQEKSGTASALKMEAGQIKVIVDGLAYPVESITGVLMQSPQQSS